MAYPSDMLTRLVKVGPFFDFSGEVARGQVYFAVDLAVKWKTRGEYLVPQLKPVQLDGSGFATKELPVSTQDNFTDGLGHTIRNFTYTVKPVLGPQAPKFPPTSFVLEAGDEPYIPDFDLTTTRTAGILILSGPGEVIDIPVIIPPVVDPGVPTDNLFDLIVGGFANSDYTNLDSFSGGTPTTVFDLIISGGSP